MSGLENKSPEEVRAEIDAKRRTMYRLIFVFLVILNMLTAKTMLQRGFDSGYELAKAEVSRRCLEVAPPARTGEVHTCTYIIGPEVFQW